MTNQLNRRNFIKRSTLTGLAGCAVLMSAKLNPLHAFDHLADSNEKIDPSKLNYCGYTCSKDCAFLKATKENNLEQKKEVFKEWKIAEKHGIEFDADKIFCWGCKTTDKPAGIVVSKCTVRKCAIEKGYEACIECDTLTSCNKQLWQDFPDFYKSVIEMQDKFKS